MNSKGNEPFLTWAEKQPNIYGNVMISSLQDKTMGFSNHFPDEKHNRGYALCVDIQNKDWRLKSLAHYSFIIYQNLDQFGLIKFCGVAEKRTVISIDVYII